MSNSIQNRYDFALVFDVRDGNPNGDPDAGNLPRVDPETGHGLVTDVCLKRKVRNYVMVKNNCKPRYDVYIKEKAVLNRLHEQAYRELGIDLSEDKGKRKGGENVDIARQKMCDTYYDVRTFGAVMSTGVNCGQVRGPVQMTFARSIDPVVPLEFSITRMAVATEVEAEKQGGDNRTMGRKFTIPYGLYIVYGFVSPALALQTGFNQDDLDLLWESLKNMFEVDRSAARGLMATRKLIVFKHDSALGSGSSNSLFDRIRIAKIQTGSPARDFKDYAVTIDAKNLPNGVTIVEMV